MDDILNEYGYLKLKEGILYSDDMFVPNIFVNTAIADLIGPVSIRDAKSTIIAAAIGSIVGFVEKNEVAKRKILYANRDEKIAQEINRITTLVSELQHINQNLKQKISELDKSTKYINKRMSTWSTYKIKLKEQKDKIDEQVRAAMIIHKGLFNETLVAEKVYHDAKANKFVSKSKMENWKRKIGDLKHVEKMLVSYIEELSAISDRDVQFYLTPS